jgi:hypothetical protein
MPSVSSGKRSLATGQIWKPFFCLILVLLPWPQILLKKECEDFALCFFFDRSLSPDNYFVTNKYEIKRLTTQDLDRPHASQYIQAEEQARKERKGLWQQNNPQPPWEFRKL